MQSGRFYKWLPAVLFIAVVMVILFGSNPSAMATMIQGRLSNFHLWNRSAETVNDVDIIISNASCSDILYHYGPYTRSCVPVGSNIRVTFSGFSCAPGAYKHFGLHWKSGVNPKVRQIYWTKDGVQTGGYIDFTGLEWTGNINCPVFIVIRRADSSMTSPWVTIGSAQWAVRYPPVPLDSLIPNSPAVTALPWQSAGSLNGTLMNSFDSVYYQTPPIHENGAGVTVQYTTLNSSMDTVGIYFEQALVSEVQVPSLTVWGMAILIILLIAATALIIRKRRRAQLLA
ncbi:hypothetical protein TRIP_C20092 [Candidatus Zixiibacteriota bacterium]|nr:hypothetical protein TRIP_C20092 [candidate division Zixibacteria bacterium]